MLTVYNCIVNEHDFRLVGLAAVICALASFTAINLLHHVRRSTGQMRYVWLAVAATATGFGIWATHFIAMLAFSPGIAERLQHRADAAVAGRRHRAHRRRARRRAVDARCRAAPGSAAPSSAAASPRCTTPAWPPSRSPGRIVWDPALVAASIALGAADRRGCLAGRAARRRPRNGRSTARCC